jgi:Zn-dependent protease with chaperone function
MNTRALAGVIAHEFGHFAQGTGMRITYLIRTIIHFFYRVVYDRDNLDARIEQASEKADYRIRLFIYLSRLMIGISRFILEKVSYVGMLVGMYTMRQMEFDADRYETRLVGSDQFSRTAHCMRTLGLAWYEADQIAAHCFGEDKTLPDNFGTLMRFALQKMPPDVLE